MLGWVTSNTSSCCAESSRGTTNSTLPVYLATEDHNGVIEVMVFHGIRRPVQQHQSGTRPKRDDKNVTFCTFKNKIHHETF
jgi:hypothetical protein